MGAGASVVEQEKQRPIDASDVDTPRGVTAKNEVARLRSLLASYSLDQQETHATGALDEAKEQFEAMTPGIQEYLISSFRNADTDGSGILSYDEFTRMIRQQLQLGLTEEEISQLETHAAYNPGSEVTWNDFVMIAPQLLKNIVTQNEPSFRDWCELTSPEGLPYYYNKRTFESTWTTPTELQHAAENQI
jgi:hypothetical protein